ncbi:TetR/AcrR family transcriptional regulator [Streptomyces sp. NPDC059753]|uniref:TetR/AcrR family transcriptional regulator n=1 Tax=Streptomyces sp. NPDC059753 TaxID=3346933 RepID=UPI00364E45F8
MRAGHAMRLSADERREAVVRAAFAEFAGRGYHGTSTEAIAQRVGVSQPYLFRFFPTKQDLFEAATDRCFQRLAQALGEAPATLEGMSRAYAELRADRDVPLMLLQAAATAASPGQDAFAARVRRGWLDLWDLAGERTGAPPAELAALFARSLPPAAPPHPTPIAPPASTSLPIPAAAVSPGRGPRSPARTRPRPHAS